MIISIEGPDFVGKNTLVEKVVEYGQKYFINKEFKVIQFPNYDTEIGKFLRKKLMDKNWAKQDAIIFQLLNTAHRYEYLELLEKAKTNEDYVLIIIRYNLSGPVYASIDGLDATKVWNLYAWFDDYLPDITFIISRKFNFDELAQEREPDHYESKIKQEKVTKIYAIAETLWKDRLGSVHHIDNLAMEDTVQKMYKIIEQELK